MDKCCSTCNKTKPSTAFYKWRLECKDCKNEARRLDYKNNPELRKRRSIESSVYKTKKIAERRKVKEEETKQLESEIGETNTICKYCKIVRAKTEFRHNRLKCKECEKSDGREYKNGPICKEKFLKWVEENKETYKIHCSVRGRVASALKAKGDKKNEHSIHYLGCNIGEYLKWIFHKIPSDFTIDNYGKVWHIDHVIPLYHFNLQDKKQQLIAFNWRNTMPLIASENLSKNKRIIRLQVEQHLAHLEEYHRELEVDLPLEFKELYAKHLVAGIPLESKLPLPIGNNNEGTQLITEPNGNNV